MTTNICTSYVQLSLKQSESDILQLQQLLSEQLSQFSAERGLREEAVVELEVGGYYAMITYQYQANYLVNE